jgi:hypothetical protein
MVPFKLKWKDSFAGLPRLHRQLFWIYGAYIVLGITCNGLVCIFNAEALADGSLLSRCVCGYIAAFWGIRLCLQKFLAVDEFLTNDFYKLGYNVLTMVFCCLTAIFAIAAFR